MSSKTGFFIASEILSLTRMPSEPYPFPFVQSDIYSAEQPGKFLICDYLQLFFYCLRLCIQYFSAIFLIDAYYEVFLWFGWWNTPNGEENITRIGAADARWIKNKKLAIETAFNYCKGTS